MGVILTPNSDTTDLAVNWWNWRPTVAVLHRTGVVSEDMTARPNVGVGAAIVSEAEAVAMADAVESILSRGIRRPSSAPRR